MTVHLELPEAAAIATDMGLELNDQVVDMATDAAFALVLDVAQRRLDLARIADALRHYAAH